MAKNKFLLLSLEDEKAKKIANTINNDSARKILDYLADRDATESQISKDLNLPASTVNYNIEQLLAAKLITWEKYHYSEKGKEVRHYTLANKYIIIAPKGEKESFLEILKKLSPAFLITIIGAFLVEYLNKNLSNVQESMMDASPQIMMKSAGLSAPAQEAIINTTPIISIQTKYFLIGSLITLSFIFLYLYLREKLK